MDTSLHAKLCIPKQGNQYVYGKQDLFSVVIAFRYLLSKQDFSEFKKNLSREIKEVHKDLSHITKAELLHHMGFPANWVNITRYRLIL